MSEDNLSIKAREALKYIRAWVMQYGRVPSVRDLMTKMEYKSPRSTMLLINELRENGFLDKRTDGTLRMIKDLKSGLNITTVSVPLVGYVACGAPLLAEENIEAYFPVSTSLAKTGGKYFLLRAKGDSMNNAGINDGDLILIKQQQTADSGQKIVALIDDEATVKEYQKRGSIVLLVPRSKNLSHKPIIIERDFYIQGIVVTTIPNFNI